MSVTVSKDSITGLKSKIQGYASDTSYKGMLMTVAVASVVLVLAFFMNILKWALVVVAAGLLITVGYRGFLKWKKAQQDAKT